MWGGPEERQSLIPPLSPLSEIPTRPGAPGGHTLHVLFFSVSTVPAGILYELCDLGFITTPQFPHLKMEGE